MEIAVPMSLILLSGFAVAVADALIKRIVLQTHSFGLSFTNPWMLVVASIYLFAIAVFAFSFLRKWDLGIVGLLQIIIYAAAVILIGIFFFQEKITLVHGIGMGLAVVAAILMNI